jgi:hypothetical protein
MARDVLWRVSGRGPNGSEGVTVTRPEETQLGKLFGSRVTAARASEMDAKIFQAGTWHTKTFARSLAPNAIVGDPICLELDTETVSAATVVRVYPSRFTGGAGASDLDVGIVPAICGGQE